MRHLCFLNKLLVELLVDDFTHFISLTRSHSIRVFLDWDGVREGFNFTGNYSVNPSCFVTGSTKQSAYSETSVFNFFSSFPVTSALTSQYQAHVHWYQFHTNSSVQSQ